MAVRFADGSALDGLIDMLAMYFKTVQKSGGGDIRFQRLSHDKKILFITFEEGK